MAVTWNPSDKDAHIVLSSGNLVAGADATSWKSGRATLSHNSGKWEYQIKIITLSNANQIMIGIGTSSADLASFCGHDTYGYGHQLSGYKWHSTQESYGSAWALNDEGAVLLDFDAGTLIIKKNGTSLGTIYSSISGTFFPMVSVYASTESIRGYFNADSFPRAATAGYSAWEPPSYNPAWMMAVI